MPKDTAQELAARLIVGGSGFARTASRGVTRGFSLVAMRTLSNLKKEGGLRIGELAQREGIAQPSMTSAVNSLANAGLVTREPDPDDARAAVVTLTPAGSAELTAFRLRTADSAAPLIEALPAEDLAALTRAAELLDQLTEQLRSR
ncbi:MULTISPECIES: MarR family winged helix-turn-helix transcriptional regulator [Brevibacterium]|uniref:HTH marR-type domain-containing protein n=1 Tax=Brevibacterium salitolerans TaxID=1403566 RepID=A0ABP5IUI2_9MICO|nr:MarR family winged helix-turn-helix transcriptional regulator [Brevibacterium sp.]